MQPYKFRFRDAWDRRMFLCCVDGAVCAAVSLFLCLYATSGYWADDAWFNVFIILLAAVVSAFVFWVIVEDENDKNKPAYCTVISLGIWGLLASILFYELYTIPTVYGYFPHASLNVLYTLVFPTATQKILLTFTVAIYVTAAVLLRIGICILLTVRNRRIDAEKAALLNRNRYRLSRLYIMLVCLTLTLVLAYLGIEVSRWIIATSTSRKPMSETLFAILIACCVAYGGEEMSKYVELFDTYVRFHAFVFVRLRPRKTVQVRYEDIFSINAKFFGNKVLYVSLRCHGFKYIIKLPFTFANHKQLYARLYREVVKVNPDVTVNTKLLSLIEKQQQKETAQ